MNIGPDIADSLYDHLSDEKRWLMSNAERCAILQVLAKSSPPSAIEVGTCYGGCLNQIRRFAARTYSIDIDPQVAERLRPEMPNVEFMTGDSSVLIGQALKRCEERGEPLGFVLIDGDHTYKGVQADIHAILQHRPTRPVWVMMHDSFNPECRRGILEAKWADNPFVRGVNIDFVWGGLSDDPRFQGQMWGGLGLALLLPERRVGDLVIDAHPPKTYSALYRASWHAPTLTNRLRWWLLIKRRGFQRRFGSARQQ